MGIYTGGRIRSNKVSLGGGQTYAHKNHWYEEMRVRHRCLGRRGWAEMNRVVEWMGATTDAQPFDLNIQAGTAVLCVLVVRGSTRLLPTQEQ